MPSKKALLTPAKVLIMCDKTNFTFNNNKIDI